MCTFVHMTASQHLEEYTLDIFDFYVRNNRMPTQREIQKIFKFKSPTSANRLVKRLVEGGKLEQDSTGKLIPIDLVSLELAFIGSIPAGKVTGFPNPSEEETSETMTLSELLTVNMTAAKLFRVEGDSMIDAGMHHGDILLVESTDKWEYGDIVIAEIDGEQMVKYVRRDKKGKTYLEAANERIGDIYPQEYLKVLAVVRRCIKCYD